MKRVREVCFNCGASATTRDHVPPKGTFPRPLPTTLMTVPACRRCNEDSRLDDEYFRWLVATLGDPTPASDDLIAQRILPRFRRRPALLRRVMAGAQFVSVRSRGGVWMGRRPAFEFDRARIQRVIEKTVRGLYFHEFGGRLEGAMVEDFVLNPDLQHLRAALSLRLRAVAPPAFSYRCARALEDERATLWLLMFFEKALFLTITRPLEERKESSGRRSEWVGRMNPA